MNRRMGTPDSSGSGQTRAEGCRMNLAFRARVGSCSRSACKESWMATMIPPSRTPPAHRFSLGLGGGLLRAAVLFG